MSRDDPRKGTHGAEVGAPPWILGHRGTPREAPENTLIGLRRALELGLDGFEYDLRACLSGEAVLMHDETLARTTSHGGLLAETALPQLFGVDAGGWFGKRFVGEPVPLFDEALEVGLAHPGPPPLHMIELKESSLVPEVLERLGDVFPVPEVRVASFLPEVVLEAQAAGLPSMLLADHERDDDRRLCRREGIVAYGVGPGGWAAHGAQAREAWKGVERWSWSLDDPRDILQACREPLVGFNTNQPERAMAIRALVRWAPEYEGDFPLVVPELIVEPESIGYGSDERAHSDSQGEWFGEWSNSVSVLNPFPWPASVRCSMFFPSGAFQLSGIPRVVELEPGEVRDLPFELKGGARSPGPDPLFAALYKNLPGEGPEEGLPAGGLLLDAPLVRRRCALADPMARRLTLLAERPGQTPASVTLQRTGAHVRFVIERAGDVQDAHLAVRWGDQVHRAGQHLTLPLPPGFDALSEGMPFTVAIEGRRFGKTAYLRWSGGWPVGLGVGAPGRLLPLKITR